MQITAQDVIAVGVVLSLIAHVFQLFHAKKTAAKIDGVAQQIEQNAPQLAQVATGAATVAQDLSK